MLYDIERNITIKLTPTELAKGFNCLFNSYDWKEFSDALSPWLWDLNFTSFKHFVQNDITQNNSQNVDKLMLIFNTINNIKQNIEDNKNNTSKEF